MYIPVPVKDFVKSSLSRFWKPKTDKNIGSSETTLMIEIVVVLPPNSEDRPAVK
jgi:hypothetical protein